MGVMGSTLGGALLGIGMAGMSKKPSYSMASDVHSSMTPSKPETPEAPTPVETGPGDSTQNAGMEAEREKEKQQAAWRQQQAQEVFTSGLGATGLAETSKKSLLGG